MPEPPPAGADLFGESPRPARTAARARAKPGARGTPGPEASAGEWAGESGAAAPLADRMRPRSLDEVVGQEQLLGPGRVLRMAIESGQLHSMILWGPPGSGKTTVASLMAQVAGA